MGDVEELYIHPIRCYSCGKVVSHLTTTLEKLIADNGDIDSFLTEKGIPPSRYCCRRTLLTPIRGLFLTSDDGDFKEEVYTAETFEEIQEVVKETNVEESNQEKFQARQRNTVAVRQRLGVFSRGLQRGATPQLPATRSFGEIAQTDKRRRRVPGKGRKGK